MDNLTLDLTNQQRPRPSMLLLGCASLPICLLPFILLMENIIKRSFWGCLVFLLIGNVFYMVRMDWREKQVLYILGDLTAGPAYRFTQWLEIVRKRTGKYRSSGFRLRPSASDLMLIGAGESNVDPNTPLPSEEIAEISLWERLGKAAVMDIESSSFSWNLLSSLHHTEHSGGTDQSDDEMNRTFEVTVNSGGVVFFALFNRPENEKSGVKESAAVIKISSSRVATQSERLGYELARWLGVRVPQARVVHNTSPEWLKIKEAAEKAREAASLQGDEVGEMTCSELLEALELSRCLFLMSYVHGSPLMENANAFESPVSAVRIAQSLGRILMLDLVIRNEDRLHCRRLGWRGNPANLLLADNSASATNDVDHVREHCDPAVQHYRPNEPIIKRTTSVDNRLATRDADLKSGISKSNERRQPSIPRKPYVKNELPADATTSDILIYAIDSGVPRRPPAGKRANDQENYPKLVELTLNSSTYSSNLLHEITGGKLGSPTEDGSISGSNSSADMAPVIAFRSGFRAGLRELQGFQIFLLTLHQKLDGLMRMFLGIIDKASSADTDKEDMAVPESPYGGWHYPSPLREHPSNDNISDPSDVETHRSGNKHSSSGSKESSESSSPTSRESWHGKLHRGSAEPLRSLRLTTKLRDFHKHAKDDAELSKELEQWNDLLKNEAVKLCQENNFSSGFLVGSDHNCVVDAYELKVRLEHILERISLISDAANTEKPSPVTRIMFIGGALAARSAYTLQHLGITHILCLCSNEIGQSDSQYPHLFEYKNFSISDEEDSNISSIFEEACEFIDRVEQSGGKVLVHCFEGRSRSATMVLAYLMLRKNMTLLEAWNKLKKVHRRAQPNDGFAKILLELDKELHGKASMEWQQRRPSMKVCPICGKNAGLSSSSLKLHLQKAHKRLSSGSMDSAMTSEIERFITSLRSSRSSSVSPTQRSSSSMLDCSIDPVD